jgi:hypothetical protein
VIACTSYEERLASLEFAARHNLLKSIQFKNDEMIQLYKENKLEGSGYFLKCRDKIRKSAGLRDLVVAQTAYAHGQAKLKRSMEQKEGGSRKKKAKTTSTPAKENQQQEKKLRKSPRSKEKPAPAQKKATGSETETDTSSSELAEKNKVCCLNLMHSFSHLVCT